MRNITVGEDLEFITNSDLPWNLLKGKNILITGANGAISSYLAESLLFLNEIMPEEKIKIFALVRNKEKAIKRLYFYKNRPDLKFIVQDVCAPVTIKEKIDIIIHAASQASPKYYGKDPVGTLSANTIGTRNLLELARIKKAENFLFFSSGEVYGEILEKDIPIKENMHGYVDTMNVRSCYAESKRMGETMCVSWFHQYGVPVKIVRPFHTYGPGMDIDDGRVYTDFVADIINNRNIIMRSDGGAVRAFCYIADATAGFFTVLLKGENGEAYNISNPKGEISVLNLGNLLVKLFQEKNLKVEKKENIRDGYMKSEISRYVADISKIKRLGWEPKYSLEEGFSRTVRSFL